MSSPAWCRTRVGSLQPAYQTGFRKADTQKKLVHLFAATFSFNLFSLLTILVLSLSPLPPTEIAEIQGGLIALRDLYQEESIEKKTLAEFNYKTYEVELSTKHAKLYGLFKVSDRLKVTSSLRFVTRWF